MFGDIKFVESRPIYLQIKDYIKDMIFSGMLQANVKLPSTRDMSSIMRVSRNTIIMAYQYLEDEGFIYMIKGKGAFVGSIKRSLKSSLKIDWSQNINSYAAKAEELDIIKTELKWEKGMISFKSIAPDNGLFDIDDFKRAFLNRMSIEGEKILNYGYAQGYRPLIDYLLNYMKGKGINTEGKDILITNGFTEGFDLILSSTTEAGDIILCENPTHNTAIKIMKLHNLDIVGLRMDEDGINTQKLREVLSSVRVKMIYLIPSYHNPTGIVMPPDKRVEVFKILEEFGVPVVEDGFNEELRYSGDHVSPIAALCGEGNSVIYTGSFSKILFPGIRIGWILADKKLISTLESVKRSRNIHTSFLDQAVFFEYLNEGNFEKYLKRARKYYKEKYEWALRCAEEFIPHRKIWGEGGLHIFVELNQTNGRKVLGKCYNKGVIFTPGDIFYLDNSGENTMRLGLSRVSYKEIEEGFKIIGEVVKDLEGLI